MSIYVFVHELKRIILRRVFKCVNDDNNMVIILCSDTNVLTSAQSVEKKKCPHSNFCQRCVYCGLN
jgi:hypothetical protein